MGAEAQTISSHKWPRTEALQSERAPTSTSTGQPAPFNLFDVLPNPGLGRQTWALPPVSLPVDLTIKLFLFSQKPVPQYWPLCASGSKPHSVTETFHRKGFSPKSHCGGITLHYMLIHFRNVSLAEVRGIRTNKAMAPFLKKLTVEWGIQTRNDTAVQWQSNGEDQSIIEGKAWIRWGPPAHWSPSSRL